MDVFRFKFGVPFTNPFLFALLPGGSDRRSDVKCSSNSDYVFKFFYFLDDDSVDVQVPDSLHLHCLVSFFYYLDVFILLIVKMGHTLGK